MALYDKERTHLDLIKDKNRVDTFIFSEAIKLYFSTDDKSYKVYRTFEIL